MSKLDRRSILVLLIIPLQFLLQTILKASPLKDKQPIATIIMVVIAAISVSLVFILRGDLLKKDFEKFKEKKWKNILISIISAVLSAVIITLVKKVIKSDVSTFSLLSANDIPDDAMLSGWLMLLGSLVPASAPFAEELVFRHELYYKIRNGKIPNFLLVIISSVLFGLMHINNYGGNVVATIPLMFVAVLYCLIYKITDTIWTPILAHFLYNGTLSILSSILVIVMNFIF